MDFNSRIQQFQEKLGEKADVAFLPIATDLQFLIGVPRSFPNFGVTLHPGAWLEGAWLSPKGAPVLALPRMTAEFGGLNRLENVETRVLGDWDDPAQMVRDILAQFKLPAKPRVALSDKAEAETVIQLQKLLPDAIFISATEIMRELRTVKSAEEIEAMRRAGAVTEAAFSDVLSHLRLGMTELDIASEVDYQLRRHGGLGPSFTTSLYNSGPEHPLIWGDPITTWKRPVNAGVSVLFDFGAAYQGWCYDYGRTVSFGAPSDEQIKVYNLVMESQRAGIAALKAGSTCEAVDAAARKVIEDAGYGELFRHRLGHGIGMDVHEPPFLTKGNKTTLVEGMMFTIEPSITQYHQASSRVEDVVVVRPDGGEPLTTGFQQLYVVE
ncbi:MAG: peptidase M24 [Chloroflexi bacterium OLB15]|nr:MAG: peptidase M24 [Chloroflexi bacterium OLB15]